MLGRGVHRLPGFAPDGPGRQLDERHEGAHRLGQGRGRVIRPARRQRLAELAERHRLGLDQAPARGGERGGVDPGQLPAERAAQAALDHRLHQLPQREAVPGGHQVDGAAHQRDPDHAPVGDQRGQVLGAEAVQPGVQAVVGREGRLGLQPDQVLDGACHLRGPLGAGLGQPRAVEEQLTGQQRAVDRAAAQHLRPWHQ